MWKWFLFTSSKASNIFVGGKSTTEKKNIVRGVFTDALLSWVSTGAAISLAGKPWPQILWDAEEALGLARANRWDLLPGDLEWVGMNSWFPRGPDPPQKKGTSRRILRNHTNLVSSSVRNSWGCNFLFLSCWRKMLEKMGVVIISRAAKPPSFWRLVVQWSFYSTRSEH